MGITRIDDAFRSFASGGSATADTAAVSVESSVAAPITPPPALETVQPIRTAESTNQQSTECPPSCDLSALTEMLESLEQSVKSHHDTTVLTVGIIVIAILINTAFIWYCFTSSS